MIKRPNLIIVFPDQMRAHQLGFLGEEPVITPHLDNFAKESLVLHQTVSNYPVCSPFRAMLMTGKYPHSNKVISNCTSKTEPYNCELQESDVCWSDILKKSGYSLGYIGKWHLDSPKEPYIDCYNNHGPTKWNEWCPPARRHSFDYWHSYGTYDHHLNPMYWDTDAKRDDFKFVDKWGPEYEADRAVEYLNNSDSTYRDSEKPFAMVVSMNPPHMPYNQVPEKYVKMYDNISLEEMCKKPSIPPAGTKWGDYYRKHIRNQHAMVTGVDEQFGRILEAVKANGLEDNTIIIFTSDHGDCLGVNNAQAKNNHYEESMRIPFIIRWPGKIKEKHDDLLFSTPDIYPTIIDLMGLRQEIPEEVEGVSYANYFLTGKGTRPTSQLYTWIKHDEPQFGKRGVRTATHTLSINVMPDEDFEIILFDNINDTYQMNNIAEQKKELINNLLEQELIPWLKKIDDPWIKHIDKIIYK